jgi:Flp pilus assembly protein TadD
MRQFDSAIADHTVAIQLEANNAEFVSNRALCYMDIKQYNLAHRWGGEGRR